jgi:hypothetical protein
MSRNGRGLTNGNGFTNGSGLTVGNGMVNGLGMTDGLDSRQMPLSKSRALAVTSDKTNGTTKSTQKGLHTRVDLINGFSIEGARMETRLKSKRRLSRKKRRAMRSMEKMASEAVPGHDSPEQVPTSLVGSVGETGHFTKTSCVPTSSTGPGEDNGGESDQRTRDGEFHC